METNQQVKQVVKTEETTVSNSTSQLEEKVAIIEQRLNEIAKKASIKADAQADTLVAKWSKQIIDSRYTYLFVGGAIVYVLMSFYICM